MSASEDYRVVNQMQLWARQTRDRYRHVAGQIANEQLALVLRKCAEDRDALIAQIDDVIREMQTDASGEVEAKTCCPMSDFDGREPDDFEYLLERLAACDEAVHDDLGEMITSSQIAATTRLAASEAMLLLEHTVKKLRRINMQAKGTSVSAAVAGE